MAVTQAPGLGPSSAPALDRVRPPWTQRRVVLCVLGAGSLLAVVWGWNRVGLSLGVLGEGWREIADLLGRMLPPRYTDVPRWTGLAIETFFMALMGTTIATGLSLPLAFLAARNTTPSPLAAGAARAVITLARAIPDLIFALVFVAAVGIGPLAGVLALGLHSIGMIGKLFADVVEEVDELPRDAVASTGASRLQALSTSVVPQVLPSFVSVALYRLDINVRISVILGIVGAGGIGFELQAALRALVYDRGLGIVTVIFVMVLLVEWLSAAMRRSLLGAEPSALSFGAGRDRRRLAALRRRREAEPALRLADPLGDRADGARPEPPAFDHRVVSPPWTVDRARRSAFAALVLAGIALSLVSVDVSPLELLGALPDVWREASRLVPPDFSTARDGIVEGMVETVAIGVVATFFGAVLSVPVGLLAARNVSPSRFVYVLARGFLVFVRGIPELILAVIFVAALGLGPVPGTLALTIGALGFLAKLVADAVEQIDPAPREAVLATGATRLQEVFASVLPQAMPSLVSSTLYLLDINIRTSTVLGIVGGGGIGFLLQNSTRVRAFETTGAIILAIFGVVFALEQLSGWARKQII